MQEQVNYLAPVSQASVEDHRSLHPHVRDD